MIKISKKKITKKRKIESPLTYFCGDNGGIYHTIIDLLPGIYLNKKRNKTVTVGWNQEFIFELLKSIGIQNYVKTPPNTLIRAKHFTYPSIGNNGSSPEPILTNKTIEDLRKKLTKNTSIEPLGSRIYVSRADAWRRRVLNEKKLIKELKKRNFSVVIPGQYTLSEQAMLFKNAEIIVGPHGMGMTNMIFSTNLKGIIELLHHSFPRNNILRLAQLRQAKKYYGLFHGESKSYPDDCHLNFNADISKVIKTIDKLIGEIN